MTKESVLYPTAEDAHRSMWTWLSLNPEKKKREWPEWDLFAVSQGCGMVNDCFCCEEAEIEEYNDCGRCPIQWVDGKKNKDGVFWCMSESSVFLSWVYPTRTNIRILDASNIANKEWKGGKGPF